jgi:hypothetical protein
VWSRVSQVSRWEWKRSGFVGKGGNERTSLRRFIERYSWMERLRRWLATPAEGCHTRFKVSRRMKDDGRILSQSESSGELAVARSARGEGGMRECDD